MMEYAISVALIIAAAVTVIGLIAIYLSEPAKLPNRVGEPRNRYGETHEMFTLRLYRYHEELDKIEKRRDHLLKLIKISNWKPLS